MSRIELYKHDNNGDPATCFATDAEIEIADQLRHRLEERYLASSAPSPPTQPRDRTEVAPFDDAGGSL